MKLSLSMRIKSNIELLKIFLHHINNRWNLTKEQVIGFLLTAILLFAIPVLSNYLFNSPDDSDSILIILC